VIHANTPDPGVALLAGTYYAVTTGTSDAGIFPIHTSVDLVTWSASGAIWKEGNGVYAPKWAKPNGDFWAPEMHPWAPASADNSTESSQAKYILVFTAQNLADGQLSIGSAVAEHPLGPWIASDKPLVTASWTGYIDATFFRDTDSTPYLIWKTDGNAHGLHTPIWQAKLDAASNGTRLAGSGDNSTWTQLITNDESWEGPLVEAPWMIKHQASGNYYLFYSGSEMQGYGVGVARSSSVSGPFTKLGAPILRHEAYDPGRDPNPPLIGTGHCSVIPVHWGASSSSSSSSPVSS